MLNRASRCLAGLACVALLIVGPARAQDEPTPPAPPAPEGAEPASPDAPPEEVEVLTVEDILRAEIVRLRGENQDLREQLAKAELEASQAARERDELRQFLADHEQLGNDFEQYQGMLELKEREMRRERAEAYREKMRQEREAREARMSAARAARQVREERREELRKYEREGFYPVGKDVFVSAMAYLYKKENVPDRSYRFFPQIRFDGHFFFTRFWDIDYDEEIDYSSMTISGSVLSAHPEPRDIGVAITFFDRYGNQVGGTTVEIEHARQDAPYPFTETLEMALDRPFWSYRIVVLYADLVEVEPER